MIKALLLVAEGHSAAEAARRCRVNRSSVHRWLVQYRAEHQTTALIDRPRSGRPRLHHTLTPQRLAAALARDPRRCGYQATSWTVPLLAHDLATKGLAVRLCIGHLGVWYLLIGEVPKDRNIGKSPG